MSEKVLMPDLIDALSREKNITKREAEIFIKTLFDLIEEALESDQYIKIKGLGAFKLVGINSRESVNVNTGERFVIAGHTRISFTPDPALRDLVNKPFAHFETVALGDGVEFGDLPEEEETEDNENTAGEIIPERARGTELDSNVTETEKSAEIELPDLTGTEEPQEKTVPAEALAQQQETEHPPVSETGPEYADGNPPEKENSKTETMKPEDKQGLPYFIAVVAIIIVVLSGTIIYVYKPGLLLELLPASGRETTSVSDTAGIAAVQPEVNPTGVADSTDTDSSAVSAQSREMPFDKVLREARSEKMVEPESPRQTLQVSPDTQKAVAQAVPVRPDSTGYVITGTKTTYTLQPGETLVMVSKRFYGTKDLWPYIARHNRDVIKNPDRVPSGTTLKVPELRKK